MNYERPNCNKNLESFRTMQTYYGSNQCIDVKGLDSLAVQVVENYDYGNCQVVVPTEASMAYGKIFNTPANAVSYRGYYNVPDAYYSAQSQCGNYRLRQCQ
jgi:hypothetical protein